MERKLTSFFTKEAKRVAEVMAAKLGIEKDDKDTQDRVDKAVASLTFDWSALAPGMQHLIMVVSTDGASQALKQLDLEDDKALANGVHQAAVDYAENRAAEMVGMKWVDGELVDNPNPVWRIDDGVRVRGEIRQSVIKALTDGLTPKQLAKDLQDTYSFSAARASTIARTEIHRADVAGNMATYRESGVVDRKQWLITNDDNCCDLCEENAAAGVIDFDDEFPSGADSPEDSHPNCQCDLRPYVKGEEED